ncbi:MAG: hypothetical protein UU47_C0002G0069 [candidate division TM6 bacterium GW2011_GWE2_41_16]|nr:MAG: hypothetical protein UU47_C0002G0069 [candidate division TM6 bacterium GW2011_GWE2_41_16]
MMKILNDLFCLISAIGAINWGLVAFLNFDLVKETTKLLSTVPYLDKILYGTIAVSGIFVVLSLFIKQ